MNGKGDSSRYTNDGAESIVNAEHIDKVHVTKNDNLTHLALWIGPWACQYMVSYHSAKTTVVVQNSAIRKRRHCFSRTSGGVWSQRKAIGVLPVTSRCLGSHQALSSDPATVSLISLTYNVTPNGDVIEQPGVVLLCCEFCVSSIGQHRPFVVCITLDCFVSLLHRLDQRPYLWKRISLCQTDPFKHSREI